MSDKPNTTLDEIAIRYRASTDHKTIHADGAWAALTSQLDIQVAFYGELQPMPTEVRHKVEQGKLGRIIKTDKEIGIVRETGSTVLMNPLTALQVAKLLMEMVQKAKDQLPEDVRKEFEQQALAISKLPLAGG